MQVLQEHTELFTAAFCVQRQGSSGVPRQDAQCPRITLNALSPAPYCIPLQGLA